MEQLKISDIPKQCPKCGDTIIRVTYVMPYGHDDIEFTWQDEHQWNEVCTGLPGPLYYTVYKEEILKSEIGV